MSRLIATVGSLAPIMTINSLPPEILLKVSTYLYPTTSACLALAFKPYYHIHRARHGNIRFHKSASFYDAHPIYRRHIDKTEPVAPADVGELHVLLEVWMRPLVFGLYNKFIPREVNDRDMARLSATEKKRARIIAEDEKKWVVVGA
jgi:hypothetical protein